jgi:hypothetical protein
MGQRRLCRRYPETRRALPLKHEDKNYLGLRNRPIASQSPGPYGLCPQAVELAIHGGQDPGANRARTGVSSKWARADHYPDRALAKKHCVD